ncbi:MAG TPA: VCBS repeat-containing protein [Gemmataceae bacterium]|nr:VCBS repeat-containing protein [Gemmataceae bacterium]
MRINTRLLALAAVVLGALLLNLCVQPAHAYVEAPMSLGSILNQSTNVVLMRVEMVNREKNFIIYRKVRDIKGKHPQEVIKHNIGRGGLRANEWKPQMDWAEPGKTAVFFHNGGASETCIGTWWYQAYGGGEWWNHSHGEPFLLRSFAGSPEKLAAIITEMLAGRETVAPCMIDGNKEDLHQRRAKIQRVRVSLKLLDYNPKRDFIGWGGEDFRRLNGMPGFTHYSALTRVDPEAQAIAALDIDGDGKIDLCLVGGSKVVLLQNGGESLNEIGLPGAGGCRAAVWADYNGDGLPDLLLATPGGPRLYTNLGKGAFRDDSHLLPQGTHGAVTAAAWIDQDGDGKPDILLANGYHGLRLYRNVFNPMAQAKAPAPCFEDISERVGLGSGGIGKGLKGDTLTVCDVDGDGRPDFLYGAGSGVLVRNTPQGFVEVKESGIAFTPGKVGPIFGDFDNDGHVDLFVPQKGRSLLFKNDGKGRFIDVTDKAGDLAKLDAWATCAAWGDVDNDGHLDLVIGCLRGPNRYLRNRGDGTFEDATERIGLGQRIFNSQAVCLVDLNNDGVLDFVFNNEGQESCVLLGSPTAVPRRTPLTVTVGGSQGVVGSCVRVLDKQGRTRGVQEISGGDGRGQRPARAHFALEPGVYRVQVRYSSGLTRGREITVAEAPVRGLIDDQTPTIE